MSEPTRSFAEVVTVLTPATPAGVTAQEVPDEIREEWVRGPLLGHLTCYLHALVSYDTRMLYAAKQLGIPTLAPT